MRKTKEQREEYNAIRYESAGSRLRETLEKLADILQPEEAEILNCLMTNLEDEVKGILEQI